MKYCQTFTLRYEVTDQIVKFVREFVKMLHHSDHPVYGVSTEDTVVDSLSSRLGTVNLHHVLQS